MELQTATLNIDNGCPLLQSKEIEEYFETQVWLDFVWGVVTCVWFGMNPRMKYGEDEAAEEIRRSIE